MTVVLHLLTLIRVLTEDRKRLALENLALRHQVAVLKRSVKRPRIQDSDRMFWILMKRMLAEWKEAVHFVKPATVVKWHRRGYVFVVLSHARRRILHVNVTDHPTAAWTAQQILEAFPEEGPRLLLHDRDRIHGWDFDRKVKALGVRQIRSAPRSPWQNAFAERVIGTVRRECTDHIIPSGRRHLPRTLREYVEYDNTSRPHQSLDRSSPSPREIESVGEVSAQPVLGGLHQRYFRAA